MDDPYLVAFALPHLMKAHLAILHADLPLVGTVRPHTADDLDEGRFPRAILTDEGVDLSRLQVERNVVQGTNARKIHRDVV